MAITVNHSQNMKQYGLYTKRKKRDKRLNDMNKLKNVISNGNDTHYESWNLRFTGKSDLTKENREKFF